ncbi:MAG: hypothetical protein L0Y80_11500 [Ignavibacteriae bacterium]|nr:hypothetical protein [Ignavibacteriota bacterium]
MTRRNFLVLIAAGILFLGGCAKKEFTFQDLESAAVYGYTAQNDSLDLAQINYTIVDAQDVQVLTSNIDFNMVLDGKDVGSVPNAYLYLKDKHGNVKTYSVVLAWQYLLDGNKWEELYLVNEPASQLLQQHMQP